MRVELPPLDDGERLERLVYSGRRLDKAKIVYEYREEGDLTRGFVLPKPIRPGMSVGTIIGRVISADHRVWISGPKAPRPLGRVNDSQVSEWDALDRAAATTKQQLIAASKTNSLFDSALETIAQAYSQTPPSQRAGLLAHIIGRLR